MRFQVTMNMPSFTGNLVHQVIAEYPVDSLEEFTKALSETDFLIVEEWYRDNETKELYVAGEVAINPLMVGKVKASR
jgi:hypothetical protein